MAQDTTLTQEEVIKFAIGGGLSLADAHNFWDFYQAAGGIAGLSGLQNK